MSIFTFIKNLFIKKPKKLGLALGSGGAKGAAHIGVIKAFEEEGIHFDMVSGASIGSVIGGLYASGLTADEMLNFLSQYELTDFTTLIYMKLKGYSITKLLDDMLGGKNFEDLNIPYYAVATDLDSGEEVDINSGNLTKAMLSSCAIPPTFKPVKYGDKRLIDGAFVNSVPSDLLKKNGADFVVGVNLSYGIDTNAYIKADLDNVYKDNGVMITDRLKKGREFSDVLLEPNLTGYKTTSIKSLYEMYDIGYIIAKQEMPNILLKLKKCGIKINKKR